MRLDDQIACVSREIERRVRAYPRQVETGQMSKQKAEREIAEMRAVLATLMAARSIAPMEGN